MKTFKKWIDAGSFLECLDEHGYYEKDIAKATAEHLLAVAEEWCKTDDSSFMSGPSTQGDNEARDLLEYLRDYIHPAAKEVQGG